MRRTRGGRWAVALVWAGLGCGDDGGGQAWEPTTGPDSVGSMTDTADTADEVETEGVCMPGETQPCLCPDGLSLGERRCADDASGFFPCECSADDGEDGSTGDPMPPLPAEVCYLGVDRSGTTCLPLVAFYSDLPAGYEYPPPMLGDGQDRPPLGLVDVQAASGSLGLAPNFQLDELAQPANGQWAVLQPHAVESLQAMRDQAGAITVVTGYLSPSANAAAGGDLYARHQWGDGFDLQPQATTIGVLAGLCADEGGMAVEFETHLHCDLSATPLDEAFFGPAPGAAPEDPAQGALDAWIEPDGHRYWAPARGFDEGEPRRVWTARDVAGTVLMTAEGRDFEPPAGTVRLEVRVGGRVERAIDLP
ncbi:MAG: hypothetical protein H6712_24950 [Myxococcales bacterium]|nr:hypothetical protein [Myxococcales bacterium]MCB9717128.1 hypothetical protein [Myxococcales bacterium]